MPLPPDEVPDGLSQAEYRKLHTMYTLMGRHEEALDAINRASKFTPAAPKLNEASALSEEEQYNMGMQIGQKLVAQILKLATNSQNGEGADAESEIDSFLLDMESDFNAVGLTEEQVKEVGKNLRNTLLQASTTQELPPRDVPEGLHAHEYYELGVHYKEIGWTEQSRDALSYAIEQDPSGEWCTKARIYFRTKLPHHPIPLAAEQMNIEGFNAMMAGETNLAYSTFVETTKIYPDFEWPFGNLGSMLIKDGKLKEAQNMLEKALSINPFYVNAWYHLCRAHLLNLNLEAAQNCLNEIEKIDPSDESLEGMKLTFKTVQEWRD